MVIPRPRPRLPWCGLASWTLVVGCLLATACATYREHPLASDAIDQARLDEHAIRRRISALHHPLLPPLAIDLERPLGADAVALLAVVLHPALRAVRDQHQLAQAQVLQAGILPNPQLSASLAFPLSGPASTTAYGLGLSWDLTSLITRHARTLGAQDQEAAIDLGIAWQEWQVAQGAKQAFYRCQGARERLGIATEIATQSRFALERVRRAYALHLTTNVDLAAAEGLDQDAETVQLDAQSDLTTQRLALNRAIGLPAPATLTLAAASWTLQVPPAGELEPGLEQHRLDLLALRQGYASQEQVLRAAVLAQFPRIALNISQARDTSGVTAAGPGLVVDLPLLDRNQGAIAIERATRERLYDDYVQRVFEARHDLAEACAAAHTLRVRIQQADQAIATATVRCTRYRAAFALAQLDAPSVVASEIDLDRQRLLALQLRQQLAEMRITIELAAGVYLPDAPPAIAATDERP